MCRLVFKDIHRWLKLSLARWGSRLYSLWDGVNPTQAITIQSIAFLERYNEWLGAEVHSHRTSREGAALMPSHGQSPSSHKIQSPKLCHLLLCVSKAIFIKHTKAKCKSCWVELREKPLNIRSLPTPTLELNWLKSLSVSGALQVMCTHISVL